MEQIQQRLALKFRLNKIDNSGIYGPILLNELFKHKDPKTTSKIVEGYLKIHTPKSLDPEVCWHLWVDVGGTIYDINQVMATMKEPEFSICTFCHETDPENPPKDTDEIIELKNQWELYSTDMKEFWKTTPMKIKNLRAKMFRDSKQC